MRKKRINNKFFWYICFFFVVKCKENMDELVINKKNWIYVNFNYLYYFNFLE